jgi:hypothetical protein
MHFLDVIKNFILEVAKQNKTEEDRSGERGGKAMRPSSADPAIRGLFVQGCCDIIVEVGHRAISLQHNTWTLLRKEYELLLAEFIVIWLKNRLALRCMQTNKRPQTELHLDTCGLISIY